MVAKESKFEAREDKESWEDHDKFAKRFCRIQHQASKCAEAFNRKLDSIAVLDPDTARVSILPCSVYYLRTEERGGIAVIVEPRFFGKFQKWNSNNGWKRRSRSSSKKKFGLRMCHSQPSKKETIAKTKWRKKLRLLR
mmetsp:Transcript_1147/g.2960  ORF Transcript_1147/g.2960 Transcript_1147/m.2960 type:complete len:138 (+) Transcript_1147:1262-1675(+)